MDKKSDYQKVELPPGMTVEMFNAALTIIMNWEFTDGAEPDTLAISLFQLYSQSTQSASCCNTPHSRESP